MKVRAYIPIWLYAAVATWMNLVTCEPAQAGADFHTLISGVELGEFSWAVTTTDQIRVTAIRIDPRLVRVQVVDARSLIPKNNPGVQLAYSLREVGRLHSPIAAINGGFTGSYVRPVPTGLIIIDGRTTSPLNRLSRSQTGIACVQQDGAVVIYRVIDSTTLKCRYAIQAGPMVVENSGKNGIGVSQKNILATRSLIGVDKMNRVIFLRTSEASLYSLGEMLSDNGVSGLNLDNALNLDGDADSGLLARTNGTLSTYGNVDATIPSALIAVGGKSTH